MSKIHPAYRSDKELCEWLRENSSGGYRLAGYAADRIETLSAHLENVQRECDRLETLEVAKAVLAANGLAAMPIEITEAIEGAVYECESNRMDDIYKAMIAAAE